MDNLISILTMVIIVLVSIIVLLAFAYLYILYRSKQKNKDKANDEMSKKHRTSHTRKSIFDFMQFDKIENDMIVQDDGQRYLMVLECRGVNYDLMSQEEKKTIEFGFIQFLNVLRYPIQLYIQTRTLNIESSIENYKSRLEVVKTELTNKQKAYDEFIKNENFDKKKAETLKRELVRVKNLYGYGSDIIENIQETSHNKNVLSKHYYIVIPYYAQEINVGLLDETQKKKIIAQELYTRAQSLASALASCEIKSSILSSKELVDLLYVAYNRDESEVYGIEKAIKAKYDAPYITAQDIWDKKLEELDKKIEEQATQLAKDALIEASIDINAKRQKFETMVKKMAKSLMQENKKSEGKRTTKGRNKRSKNTKKGWNVNEKKQDGKAREVTRV